jgi:signal peptidase I
MASRRAGDDASDGDDLDALFGEPRPKKRSASPPPRTRSASPRAPIRGWKASDDPDDELDGPAPPDRERRVFWRARDSLWFEPLVALAVIVVLLVGLFAYTANWPPVYVVESNSMQHGTGDRVGYITAGDVVLAQRTAASDIATYFPSVARGGPSNYGEPGDVIVYRPFGSTSATPVVHRAILFLQYDKSTHAYNATSLEGLPCSSSSHPYYSTSSASSCNVTEMTGTLLLYHVGWQDLTLSISFSSPQCVVSLGGHSGFLTLGDNNPDADQVPGPGCGGTAISTLVEPGWVVGVAQGLLPWFGAIKLLFDGNSQFVPGASWEYLGLSVAGIVIVGAGIHFLLRRLGVRSEIRRREERRQEREGMRGDPFDDEDDRPSPVRSWRAPDVDGEREPPPAPKLSPDERRRTHVSPRTRPHRPHGRPTRPPDDEDEADLT